ncbi:TonB-dependent receptor [Pontibacter silvestris]|uniref:TonB-dependent receptor n=1 Tax=Pontibacter silvestris TaxID=2305183 RepID=A0ABW4WSV5_9BACT|nr:TonB-dependent receptor [Pontibacter silvestris]MCC9138596.1 TonB-dependent receptor [Pontibacter silvestris]
MKHVVRLRFGLLLALALLTSLAGWAQGRNGSIKGKVQTVTGVPLPGATVVLTETSTATSTDQSGNYILKNIPSGNYTLKVSFQGFTPHNEKVSLKAGATETVNVSLKESTYNINEVVVSTQKRTQTSIEVPIAVSALDGKTLDRLNITEFDALAEYVPGLQIQLQSPNNPGFVIRGITSDDGDSRVQPRVSVFQDGVSISRARGAAVELFDMERVEVVKGPQGTLFGRGAQIGAVHLIQNKPVDYVTGELKVGYGNYDQKIARGFINTPILEGKLLNRFAFSYNDRDGFINNRSGGKLNGKSTYAFRDVIRVLPGEHTTADLILNYQYDDYPGTSFKSKAYAPAGGDTEPNTTADLEQGENLYIKRNVFGPTLIVNHNLSGRWALTSTSAYRYFKADESFDADGTAAPALWLSEVAKGEQVSQELRFNYTNQEKFSGFFGANYFYENGYQRVPFRTNEQSMYTLFIPAIRQQIEGNAQLTDAQKQGLLDAIPLVPLVTNGVPNYVTNIPNIPAVFNVFAGAPLSTYHEEENTNFGKTSAFEIFADGTYDFTDKLSVTAGLRGTYEKQTGAYQSNPSATPSPLGIFLGTYPNILFAPSEEKISTTKDYFSYVGRLAANYLFSRNSIYVSVARGRRPGVIDVQPDQTTYLKPEIVWSYEAGVKGNVLGGKLNYDFSTYYYDWNNFQTTVYNLSAGGLGQSIDAGKAHSFGIETGLKYNFMQNSSVFANYGYINGEFNDKDSDGNPQEYAGNTFRLTPKHTISAGIDFNKKLGDIVGLYVRPSYSYKSKVYFEDSNSEALSQEGYGIANLMAGFSFNKATRYEIGVFAKNLFDEKYIIDAGNTGNAFGIPTFVDGQRTLYGLEFKVSF